MTQGIGIFEPLPMKKRSLLPVGNNIYCVKRRNGETFTLEAGTAYEAFNLCGIKDAIKIERMVNIKYTILSQKQFTEYKDNAQENLLRDNKEATLLDKVIRERKQVLSPDDMIKIVASLSNQMDKPVVNEQAGIERHNDGFDEIIPSNNFVRNFVRKENSASVSLPVAMQETPAVTSLTDEIEEENLALSQQEIEKLLQSE